MPERHPVVKFSPSIWRTVAGYGLGFIIGFLIMLCLILLGAV
jgi:hypothetical protein